MQEAPAMPPRLGPRIVVIAAVGLAYVLGTHWLMTRAQASHWNVVGVLAPMLAAVAVGAWRGGQRALGVGAALAVAALCALALFHISVSAQVLYLAQHAGINLFLAVVFGSTLRPGHTPLITTMAKRVHQHFTPALATYTRKLTLAWVLYFSAMAVISLLLFAVAPFDTWAFFANLLTPVAVALMFVGEYLLRYRLHPEFERHNVFVAVRADLHHGETSAAARDTAA